MGRGQFIVVAQHPVVRKFFQGAPVRLRRELPLPGLVVFVALHAQIFRFFQDMQGQLVYVLALLGLKFLGLPFAFFRAASAVA